MCVAFLVLAVAASQLSAVEGSWDLRAGQVTIFRFVVDGRSKTRVTWTRPKHFQSDGESYSQLAGGSVRQEAKTVRPVGNDLEAEFPVSETGAPPISIRFHPTDFGHAQAIIEGSDFEPLQLVRSSIASQLGPWDANATYTPTIARPTNAEMTAIFEADQADRKAAQVNWTIVGPADQRRRKRTEELLDAGKLQSGDDYYHAAFVFQHGSSAADFLKAHILAMVAMARGKTTASWIAAATLDRYLQRSGQPQVLGTQFQLRNGAPASQEPYDRSLISDAVRTALHVPPLAAQESQRQQYGSRTQR